MDLPSSREHRRPDVDAREMLELKRLEAELFALDGQLRRFDRIRERLVAAGKDPSDSYRKFQTRRRELLTGLERSRPSSQDVLDPQTSIARPNESLLSLPIASAKFDHTSGIFGLGSSGMVQVGTASDGTYDVVQGGPFPTSGEVFQVPGGYPGEVLFSGNPHVGPEQIPEDDYDPTVNYFWIRTWKYLIPFPSPDTPSVFTYRLDGYARLSVFGGGEAYVMCFVSLGETSDLTQGTDVTVDIGGGWPLIADLSQPGDNFNGHYGWFEGQNTPVQRSFLVGRHHVPGVAVIVGVVAALSMMSGTQLSFSTIRSSVSIGLDNRIGRVEYSYEPQLVVEQ